MGLDFDLTEQGALDLDTADPLAMFRDRFRIPPGVIYMDGNSLGLMSKSSEESIRRVMDEWRTLGIRGWLEATPPWFSVGETLGAMAAALVGAGPDEVVATGTTTGNIHSLVGTFFTPRERRTKILADELTFPSDIYALKGQLRIHGLDPQNDLVLVRSRDGRTLDEKDILSAMTGEVAVALFPSVLYRSGQLLDMALLTREAHRQGILIGFDCCHSAGAVPHRFDDWGVDFAMWCGYKYMNGGPGSPAFLYVNRRHFGTEPLLAGWFGYVKDKQFDLLLDFEHQKSAGGWQISSPGILGAAPLEGALGITLEAGIENIRRKQIRLTSYLMHLVDHLLSREPYGFRISTPREPERRGGHVAVERDREAYRISAALRERGVIPDFRPPNIIRIAPVALYNTFHEVWRVANHLKDIVDTRGYERFSEQHETIT